ncbi:MarR family transcriptional regulator [Microbacterium sp. 4R-513]|uniref:MarR family winged helix-turn-helix transcriptional regulator n=1 Tax=Microbacterium sp. 4R-513 TaxID=2567934 RepID=UPI0013E0FB98|nr:MarR family transcriptional regulator [Microbacterium sp. 4R-513]QIG38107.1 MarR family transcriptional regulator [Microbacterium sp. 4R-513]
MIALRPTLVDLVSLAGGASDAVIAKALDDAGFPGLRVRHGYVFQRLLVAPTTITDLARSLGVTQQAMSKTIAELTSLGYVEASVDSSDARRRTLALSERGREAIEAARTSRARLEKAVRTAVGDDRLAAAHQTLEALLAELGIGEQIRSRSVPDPSG